MDINKIDELIEGLERLKDELVLQANLGGKEAEDEFKKLEPFYEDLKNKVAKLVDITGDTASELKSVAELGIDSKSTDDIEATLELTGEELKKSFNKIKDII